MELLKQRYPDLGFLLSFFPYDEVVLSKDPQPLIDWLESQKLSELEVIYLVGLIAYDLPDALNSWLRAKKERALIFIEEDLGAFASFSQDALLKNPQVHFHYASEDPIEGLAQQFPTERLAIFEGKAFDGEQLKRRSTAYSALYSDVLYSHKIVENVIGNIQKCEGVFDAKGDFKGVPAVICGAGPSLENALPNLEALKDRALVFAGGTAIAAMTSRCVKPHFGLALDPNDEEFERLRQAHYFEGAFLFAPRLHRDVFSTVNGPFGYMKTDTGGLIENWLEKELGIDGDPVGPDLGDEAFSVTTLAISYAYALGCNPIILAGVDLAYTGGKRYVGGVQAEQGSEEKIKRVDVNGDEVETQLKWVMESECISAFAKAHPEVSFLNATEGGIGFSEIGNTTLKEALGKKKPQDLEGMLHQWIQTSPLAMQRDKLPKLFSDLKESLERCDALVFEILQELEKKKETGKLILLESDFAEELA